MGDSVSKGWAKTVVKQVTYNRSRRKREVGAEDGKTEGRTGSVPSPWGADDNDINELVENCKVTAIYTI